MVSSVCKGMADENNEDDSWLYGSSENQDNQDEQQSQSDEKLTTNESGIDEENAGASGNDKYDPDDQQVSGQRCFVFFSIQL